ncbi:lysophospholipid acyltransferase family protein [Thiovibrio sp. JS02]
MAMKKKGFVYHLLLAIVPPLYSLLSRVLFATCRVTVSGEEHRLACEAGGRPFIAVFWHYSVFNMIELHRDRGKGWAAMVSASDDAEFVARILARKGYVTARGSRNRGGLSALKGLVAAMKSGCRVVIVADGSQGPPRRMQAGALLLAGRMEAPILPMVMAADRYWAFRSWDKTLLPKPFARIHLRYGEPLRVEAKADGEALEKARLVLEGRLNGLYTQAWQDFGRESHDGLRLGGV